MKQTYLVITNKGYWGRDESLHVAAKNANIGTVGRKVFCTVFRSLDTFQTDLGCTGYGGSEWKWTEGAMELTDEQRNAIKCMSRVGDFDAWFSKNRLILQMPED